MWVGPAGSPRSSRRAAVASWPQHQQGLVVRMDDQPLLINY